MIIPVGYMHIQHFFFGSGVPNGAAVTYGIGGFGVGDPEGAAEAMHDAFASTLLTQMTDKVALGETRAKAGPSSTGPFATYTEAIDGGVVAAAVSPQVSVLVEKRTALGGRSGRGRFYVPGMSETDVDQGGNIPLATLANWQASATSFLTAIEAVSTGMFLLHTASSDPTRVTSLQVDPLVATQRRRLR